MKLQEVCEVYSGYALKEFHDSDEGYPVIKIGNICSDGTLDLDKCQFTNDSVNEKYFSKKGDIYVALSGATTGKIGIINTDDKYIINQRVGVIRKSDKEISDQYIKYFLMNKTEKILEDASGCAQPNISPKQIGQYEFPKLGYAEMNQISYILDKVSSVITQRKQELLKLDELIKSRFIELFGDGHDGKTQLKMLGSICKFQQGTQIPVEEQFEEQISGYKRFLRIIDYTQAPQPPRYVNVNGKEVDEKSVVIVRYGATAGFVGRGYQGILANNLFEIMPDETILSKDFLFLALKYGTFEEEVHTKAFGAAMPALSFSMMNDIPVVVPVMEQQQQFVSFVEQVDKSKLAVQRALDEAQLLFDSLMQKYFG